MLAANPWLGGRLRKVSDDVALYVPREPDVGPSFAEADVGGLAPAQPMESMRRAVEGLLVKRGSDCLGADEPLFRVILARTAPGRFAVVVSMAHVLGDGHTFYQLHSMLDHDTGLFGIGEVFLGKTLSLEARRKPSFMRDVALSLGASKLEFASSYELELGQRLRKLLLPKKEFSAWSVSSDWVDAEKARAASRVSTNDVLTSWFLREGRYNYGFMAINLRGRLPGLEAADAGNYSAALQFWPEEFREPEGIRRCLRSSPRFQAGRPDTPQLLETLSGSFGAVTNWTGLFQEMRLPGCRQVLHIPLPASFRPDGGMVVFRPRAGELGVVLCERRAPEAYAHPALAHRIC